MRARTTRFTMACKVPHCQAQCCHAPRQTCIHTSFDLRQASSCCGSQSQGVKSSFYVDAAAGSSQRSLCYSVSTGGILKSAGRNSSLNGTGTVRPVHRGTADDSSEDRQSHSRIVNFFCSLSALVDCRDLLPLYLAQDSRRRSEVCGSCLTLSVKMMFVVLLTLCAVNSGHGTSLLCVNITACTGCSQNVRLPVSANVI